MKILLIASARNLTEEFRRAAHELGAHLAGNGHEMIYGGGDMGLMGIAAGSARANGVPVKGIIPEAFYTVNPGKPDDVSSTQRVADLFERKKEMIQQCDIGVALPGGVGSLDEICEMCAANDILAYSKPDAPVKPVVVLNLNGFYDGLKMQFERCVRDGAIAQNRMKMIHFAGSVGAAISAIDEHRRIPLTIRELN